MKALRYENRSLAIRDVAKPAAAGEAVVRVTLAGICNTDLEIVRGNDPFQGTLGHEFVGVVESTTDPRLEGARVVGEINAGCGNCPLCRAGDPRHCPDRTELGINKRDGAFAEFLRLPAVNLLPVPDSVPDEVAVFTEPLAAAWSILERTAVTAQTRVAVIGDGKLGLLCAQVLDGAGAAVLLIGRHAAKLGIAARRNIETVHVGRMRPAGEFDIVVDASGENSGFALALDLVRPRGTLVLKSTFHGTTTVNAMRLVDKEVRVVGSRCGRFLPALALLERNAVDVESLISEEYRLGQGVAAMASAARGGVLKVLLRMGG